MVEYKWELGSNKVIWSDHICTSRGNGRGENRPISWWLNKRGFYQVIKELHGKENRREILPFKNNGKGCNSKGGKCMAIDNKNPVTHSPFEAHHCNNIHPCVTKLQGNHSQVRLHLVEEWAKCPTKHLVCHFSPSLLSTHKEWRG